MSHFEIFKELPITMLGDIFDNLDTKSLINLCETNKLMNEKCKDPYFQDKYTTLFKEYSKFEEDLWYSTVRHTDVISLILLNEQYGKSMNGINFLIENDVLEHPDNVFYGACLSDNIEGMKLLKSLHPETILSQHVLNLGLKYSKIYNTKNSQSLLMEWGAENDKE